MYMVIIWHILNDPDARYVDLGSDYYTSRLDPDRKTRDLLLTVGAFAPSDAPPRTPDLPRHDSPAH